MADAAHSVEIGGLAVNWSRYSPYRYWVPIQWNNSMATGRAWVCAALTLLSVLATSLSAGAQNLTAHPIDSGSLSINPTNTDESQSRGDDASRTADLESTRAALDRRSGPALSLSISGWVGEQVIYAH